MGSVFGVNPNLKADFSPSEGSPLLPCGHGGEKPAIRLGFPPKMELIFSLYETVSVGLMRLFLV